MNKVPIIISPEPITIGPDPPTVRGELREQDWRYVTVYDNGVKRFAYYGDFKGNHNYYKGFVWCDDNSISIKNLPRTAKLGNHHLCFSLTRNGWYLVHFNYGMNPLARICAIEEYLKEVGE